MSEETTRRKFKTFAAAAQHFKVTSATIQNWIGAGYITGYRMADNKILVDANEIEAAFLEHSGKMRDGRKKYGPNARIVNAPVIAVNNDTEAGQ